jgi:uncharacterized protein YqgC (DUF456 family)
VIDPLWFLAILMIGVGVAGTILPGIPGPALIFAGMVVAAWADGFQKVGIFTLGILLALTLLTFVVDYAAAAVGAKRAGASKWGILGAAVGTVAGLFFGLPGLIVGPYVGAFAGEYAVRRKAREAGRVGFATWLGLLAAAVANIALIFAMIGVFAFAVAI